MANFTSTMSYKMLNASSNIGGLIKKSIKNYTELDIDKISGQMIDMDHTPLNRGAMWLLRGQSGNRSIKMMVATDERYITMALPFVTYSSGGKIVTNVYVENIGRVAGEKFICNTNALYSLLGAGYIANSVFQDYGDLTGRDLMVPLMNVYTDMVVGIFNVLVHARADKKLSDIITYGARRFFIENMINVDDEDSVSHLCIKGLNNIEQSDYEKAKQSYDDTGVKEGTLETWLKWVCKISPKTATINKKVFIERWIKMYGEYSFFAMDNVEYLIGAILMTMAFVNGYNRSLQTLIKNTKTYNKLNSALNGFDVR